MLCLDVACGDDDADPASQPMVWILASSSGHLVAGCESAGIVVHAEDVFEPEITAPSNRKQAQVGRKFSSFKLDRQDR